MQLRQVLAEMWIELFELSDFARGAPAEIAVSCVASVIVGDGLDAAGRVEARGHFMGQALVLRETVLTSQSNRLLVQTHGLGLTPFEAGDLGRHQCVLVGERR